MRWLRWYSVGCGVVLGVAAAACSSLLSADPTPVPGAAATLTRSARTAIPTSVRTPDASPAVSPVAARAALMASPSAAPAGTSQAVQQEDVAQVQRRMAQVLASPDLAGVETLLLDHVSLATAQGGSVMDSAQAAAWLRDHAGAGIKVTRLEQDTQTQVLQALTDGWPTRDPIQQGHVSFSLRRYDASGRLDEDLGTWKIDVIQAD